jgi:hypothetical protein
MNVLLGGKKKEVFAIIYSVPPPPPPGVYSEETQAEQPIIDTKYREGTYGMLGKQPNLIFVIRL